MTNAQLTARYNELSGKSIKPGSYSNTKLTAMIASLEAAAEIADEAAAFDKAAAELDKPAKPAKRRSTDDDAIGAKQVFTLSQLARQLGINPKIARARYRAFDNDGLRTKYIFEMSKAKVAEVTRIITKSK